MPMEAECPGEAMTLTSSKAAGSNVTDGVKNSSAHFEYSEAGFEKSHLAEEAKFVENGVE
jgi:hypothetical protein